MCKFNVMCQAKDGTCNCCKSPPFSPQVIRPVLPSAPSDTTLLYHLYALVTQQNEVIRTLAEQTSTALKKVETLTKGLEAASLLENSSIVVPREEITTPEHILMILCGTKTNHPYSLRLLSQIPQPAYKERAFSLMIEIVDNNNNKVNMPIPVNIKIMLFTTESPPKLMKINTSGDKIMRGTVEVETNGVALFRKIVIKEVTSHFRNGCFFLAIVPKNCNDIKPLIIENFVIKARKILANEPVKKIKTDDSPETSFDPSPPV
ncbi:hypothetical protein SteCoe_10096 [Stentor coeruleus]|uniref:Uncharacterized protein n=1 Tax=Stentor coeruleus TaxID=5963 RepID=A0A1R2CG81_9CILI|nr:hypothetical protein SteCoe_10096 [Stentor coeruleus]